MEELGTIRFNIKYDAAKEILDLTVVEGEDIPVRDLSGYTYAYVIVKIMPLHDGEGKDEEFPSNMVRAGFWPAYNYPFSFHIPKRILRKQTLYIFQYELNRFSKRDGIGQVCYKLKKATTLVTGKEIQLVEKLRPYDPLIGMEIETGIINVVLTYDKDTSILELKLKEADIVPLDDEMKKANTYISGRLLDEEDCVIAKANSRVVADTLKPDYKETLIFNIPEDKLSEYSVVVRVKMKTGILRKNPLLGQQTINVDDKPWEEMMEEGSAKGMFIIYAKPKGRK